MAWTKSKTRIVATVAVILLLALITVVIVFRHQPLGKVQKDFWTPAGYASPEAALQTYFWALNQQDLTNLQASMTASAREGFAKGLKDAGETTEQFFKETAPELKKVTGYPILKTQAKTADEIDLQIAITGGVNANDWMTIKKVGTEWKVDEDPF